LLKLIIFDLWGTLAYRDAPDSLMRMLHETGLSLSREEFVSIFETSLQLKRWESKLAAYANLCKNMGLPVTDENVHLLMRLRDENEAMTKLYPHTIPLLRQLKRAGYATGFLSNSSNFMIQRIRKTPLLQYIDYPVFSFDVGAIKPDHRMFQAVLERTHRRPEECVMIGDKMSADVTPARELGIHAILYTSPEQLQRDLAELGISVKL